MTPQFAATVELIRVSLSARRLLGLTLLIVPSVYLFARLCIFDIIMALKRPPVLTILAAIRHNPRQLRLFLYDHRHHRRLGWRCAKL